MKFFSLKKRNTFYKNPNLNPNPNPNPNPNQVKSHQSGRAHIFDEGGADSRAEQQWRMAVENIRAMNLQRQARLGVRLRCQGQG